MQLGITNALNLIRTCQLSPVELVQSYLDRIESINPSLNVYLTVMADEALATAKAAEQAVAKGHTLVQKQSTSLGIRFTSSPASGRGRR